MFTCVLPSFLPSTSHWSPLNYCTQRVRGCGRLLHMSYVAWSFNSVLSSNGWTDRDAILRPTRSGPRKLYWIRVRKKHEYQPQVVPLHGTRQFYRCFSQLAVGFNTAGSFVLSERLAFALVTCTGNTTDRRRRRPLIRRSLRYDGRPDGPGQTFALSEHLTPNVNLTLNRNHHQPPTTLTVPLTLTLIA